VRFVLGRLDLADVKNDWNVHQQAGQDTSARRVGSNGRYSNDTVSRYEIVCSTALMLAVAQSMYEVVEQL
jgi:hypothetical protein